MKVGERLLDFTMKGVEEAYVLAMHLTDHLTPKVGEVQGSGSTNEMLRSYGWREIETGPLSGSMLVKGNQVEESLRDIYERRGFIFKLRQRVSNLLEGVKP